MATSNSKRFENKVALITGGASGIGKCIAERFVAEGAKVVIADISADGLNAMKKELGAACLAIKTDVTKEAEVEKAVAAAVSNFGHLDIIVTSAGVGGLSLIVDYTEEGWDTEIDVCLKGTLLCMKHAGRQMIAQGKGGCIINIASLNSQQPAEGMAAYCSAKAGVEMLTKVGAMEMGPHKIRVNAISPGLIATPLTVILTGTPSILENYLENIPLGRSGIPEDVAHAALFLASDEASWITAENLFVDGGTVTKRYPQLFKLFAAMQ